MLLDEPHAVIPRGERPPVERDLPGSGLCERASIACQPIVVGASRYECERQLMQDPEEVAVMLRLHKNGWGKVRSPDIPAPRGAQGSVNPCRQVKHFFR